MASSFAQTNHTMQLGRRVKFSILDYSCFGNFRAETSTWLDSSSPFRFVELQSRCPAAGGLLVTLVGDRPQDGLYVAFFGSPFPLA